MMAANPRHSHSPCAIIIGVLTEVHVSMGNYQLQKLLACLGDTAA